jgi:DGQHR domain-containing protein
MLTLRAKKENKMIIERTAVKIQQGELTIYATSLKVEHLMKDNFYQVDKLDSSESGSGYQRVLDKTRAKKLAKYLVEGYADGDAFLPTSIFLATNSELEYDEIHNKLTINLSDIGPFNVVDGQHRIEGLIQAANENPELKNFEILANIADNLDDINQMCHFLIVNTTQKSVDRSVEQQIVARLSGMIDLEDIPTLPKWIQKQVLKGEDREALVIVNYLNNEPDSPWKNKIRMANDLNPNATINQSSFVQSLKLYILTSSNPLAAMSDIDRRNNILKNYWKAISELLVDDLEDDTVIFKTIGLELFSLVSTVVITKLMLHSDYRVATIKSILSNALQQLPNEYIQVQYADWWKSGGGASSVNKQAARKIAHELNKCINSPNISGDQVLL